VSLILVSLNAYLSIIAALYIKWAHKNITYYPDVSWRVDTSDSKSRRSHFDILRGRSYFDLLMRGDCCKKSPREPKVFRIYAGARSHQFFQVTSSPKTFSPHHIKFTCNSSLTLWSTLNTLVASFLHMLNVNFAIFITNTNYFRVIGTRPEPKFYISCQAQDGVRADP